jgi:hypothetical protein
MVSLRACVCMYICIYVCVYIYIYNILVCFEVFCYMRSQRRRFPTNFRASMHTSLDICVRILRHTRMETVQNAQRNRAYMHVHSESHHVRTRECRWWLLKTSIFVKFAALYICIYIYMYVCMYVCICICICVRIAYICIHVHFYSIYSFAHVCIFVRVNTVMYACIYIHTYIHTRKSHCFPPENCHSHMNTHTHTCAKT